MIIIDQNKITVEEYLFIKVISETEVIIHCKDNDVVIEGIDLMVSGLNKYEIIIKGKIRGLSFHESNA